MSAAITNSAGKYEVEFKLGNLTRAELQLCANLKALLCDPRFEKLRRRLNSGAGVQVTTAGALQLFGFELESDPNQTTHLN